MESKILIDKFFIVGHNGDHAIRENDLGWADSIKQDAQSDYPENIFRYVVEVVGFNILFYWLEDRNFYTIETEKTPIEVRRIYPNPNWDGKYEYQKAGMEGFPHTSSQGEILATFDNPTRLWDNLKINGVCIGEVLDKSFIASLD